MSVNHFAQKMVFIDLCTVLFKNSEYVHLPRSLTNHFGCILVSIRVLRCDVDISCVEATVRAEPRLRISRKSEKSGRCNSGKVTYELSNTDEHGNS